MDNDADEEVMERWDVLFLLTKLPQSFQLFSGNFFFQKCPPEVLEKIRDVAGREPAMHDFRALGDHEAIDVGVFRITAAKRDDAISDAFETLSGLIDAISVVCDETPPKIWSPVLIRKGQEAETFLVARHHDHWISIVPKDPQVRRDWDTRNHSILEALMPFFHVVEGLHPNRDTPLAHQLRFAFRLFRHGMIAPSWGVQFVCKFAALESLVCGGEPSQKGEKLRKRVPTIFPGEEVAQAKLVAKLWKLRNDAVHEARVSYSERLPGGKPLQIWIDDLDRMFVAVATFAVRNLDRCKSPRELWSKGEVALVQASARQKRPIEMPRFALSQSTFSTSLVFTKLGPYFDQRFEVIEGHFRAANAGNESTSGAEG